MIDAQRLLWHLRLATSRDVFPAERLSRADYGLGLGLLVLCFALFFHDDIWGVGWDSLNYLFGDPLQFYENCKRIRGGGQTMAGTPYPPPTYLVFALWLYPLKLFGLITDAQTLPHYWTYWLKVPPMLAYAGSAAVFHRIALVYSADRDQATYATVAWLTMPLALFSQFIMSQYDIFYVLPTMAGFLMFLRRRLLLASLLFGVAITFKYFPAFVFLPLLLLFEKRIARILMYCLVCAAPMLLIELVYGHSPAFVEGVNHHAAIDRVFSATLDLGVSDLAVVYVLPAVFAVMCAVAYFIEPAERELERVAAYVWLVAAVLPFIFILWHPQWLMFVAPAIALTSTLESRRERFMMLDIAGMLLFLAVVCLTFANIVDTALFKGQWLGVDPGSSYLMADLFKPFGERSLDVFYSGFCAYLILQVVLKFPLRPPAMAAFDYGPLRYRFYIGLLSFLLPAAWCIYRDLTGSMYFTTHVAAGEPFGELSGTRSFEQTFVAHGRALRRVSLFVRKSLPLSSAAIKVEVLDDSGRTLATLHDLVAYPQRMGWHDVQFDPIPMSPLARYRIRLTGAEGGNSLLTWWASADDSYPEGQAIVDGIPRNGDFSFRIGFLK